MQISVIYITSCWFQYMATLVGFPRNVRYSRNNFTSATLPNWVFMAMCRFELVPPVSKSDTPSTTLAPFGEGMLKLNILGQIQSWVLLVVAFGICLENVTCWNLSESQLSFILVPLHFLWLWRQRNRKGKKLIVIVSHSFSSHSLTFLKFCLLHFMKCPTSHAQKG